MAAGKNGAFGGRRLHPGPKLYATAMVPGPLTNGASIAAGAWFEMNEWRGRHDLDGRAVAAS
jgi:hypothetical protein